MNIIKSAATAESIGIAVVGIWVETGVWVRAGIWVVRKVPRLRELARKLEPVAVGITRVEFRIDKNSGGERSGCRARQHIAHRFRPDGEALGRPFYFRIAVNKTTDRGFFIHKMRNNVVHMRLSCIQIERPENNRYSEANKNAAPDQKLFKKSAEYFFNLGWKTHPTIISQRQSRNIQKRLKFLSNFIKIILKFMKTGDYFHLVGF